MYIDFYEAQNLARINFSDSPVTSFKRLHQSMEAELLLGKNNKLVALCVYSYSDMRAGLESLLKEDEFLKELPEKAIVFYDHQGYQFYFLLQEESSYHVYTYLEGQTESDFTKLDDSLPSFLVKLLNFDYGMKVIEV